MGIAKQLAPKCQTEVEHSSSSLNFQNTISKSQHHMTLAGEDFFPRLSKQRNLFPQEISTFLIRLTSQTCSSQTTD